MLEQLHFYVFEFFKLISSYSKLLLKVKTSICKTFFSLSCSSSELGFLRDPRNVVRNSCVNARKSWSTAAYAGRDHSNDYKRSTSDH